MRHHEQIDSPIGPLRLVGDGDALLRIEFHAHRTPAPAESTRSRNPVVALAIQQLDEYFAGTRRQFDLPLAPSGTPFQLAVWEVLATIPYGRTMTYGDVAARLGDPGGARAVGAANHANPLPIVIPCHRVIGAGGRLVGFGGGLEVKADLLALERGERRLF